MKTLKDLNLVKESNLSLNPIEPKIKQQLRVWAKEWLVRFENPLDKEAFIEMFDLEE